MLGNELKDLGEKLVKVGATLFVGANSRRDRSLMQWGETSIDPIRDHFRDFLKYPHLLRRVVTNTSGETQWQIPTFSKQFRMLNLNFGFLLSLKTVNSVMAGLKTVQRSSDGESKT